MKYFVLEVHTAYIPPRLTKWQGILDAKTMQSKKKNFIPKYTIFQIEDHIQTVFTDILTHPCLMVSDETMEILKLYEPTLKFERLTVTDPKTKQMNSYHIPLLETLNVLTSNSRLGRDGRKLDHIEIDHQKTKGRSIFQINSNGTIYVIANLNLVESLLRRTIIGIGLKEVDVI